MTLSCKCGGRSGLRTRFVADTGTSPDKHYAYNVYQCQDCDMIVVEHVWREPNVILWIDTECAVQKEFRSPCDTP